MLSASTGYWQPASLGAMNARSKSSSRSRPAQPSTLCENGPSASQLRVVMRPAPSVALGRQQRGTPRALTNANRTVGVRGDIARQLHTALETGNRRDDFVPHQHIDRLLRLGRVGVQPTDDHLARFLAATPHARDRRQQFDGASRRNAAGIDHGDRELAKVRKALRRNGERRLQSGECLDDLTVDGHSDLLIVLGVVWIPPAEIDAAVFVGRTLDEPNGHADGRTRRQVEVGSRSAVKIHSASPSRTGSPPVSIDKRNPQLASREKDEAAMR